MIFSARKLFYACSVPPKRAVTAIDIDDKAVRSLGEIELRPA
jgi:hypothetical protein